MKVTPQLEALTDICKENSKIDVDLYGKYDVKRGLRDINGKGVLAGLTQISNIVSSKVVDGKTVPCEGELYYRGINIEELTQGFLSDKRFGFEENYQINRNWKNLKVFWPPREAFPEIL